MSNQAIFAGLYMNISAATWASNASKSSSQLSLITCHIESHAYCIRIPASEGLQTTRQDRGRFFAHDCICTCIGHAREGAAGPRPLIKNHHHISLPSCNLHFRPHKAYHQTASAHLIVIGCQKRKPSTTSQTSSRALARFCRIRVIRGRPSAHHQTTKTLPNQTLHHRTKASVYVFVLLPPCRSSPAAEAATISHIAKTL